MRRRKQKHSAPDSAPKDLLPIFVLFLCFTVSGLVGCMFVANSGEESSASFAAYLSHYAAFLSTGIGSSPSFFSVLLEFVLFPVLIFFLGFSSLGILLIPGIFCARAFLLSYAVSAIFHVFGVYGFIVSLALFGLHILISIPVSFAVGCCAFPASIRRAFDGGSVRAYFADCISPFASCWMLILPGTVLQWAVMPSLLSAVFRQIV